jgi:hypothetical protein
LKRVIVACVVTAMVAGAATATAGQLITGADIQDRSIRNRDIARGTITSSRLSQGLRRQLAQRGSALSQSGAPGRPGAQGAQGGQGVQGAAGQNGQNGKDGAPGQQGPPGPVDSAANWGIINRNTIGSPQQELRSGPFDAPIGEGSLNVTVMGAPLVQDPDGAGPLDPREKAAFGNEVDFAGDPFAGITQLGFRVYQTGENVGRGNPNMPNISIEIDPNLSSTGSNFSTVTFLPAQSPANQWSDYIDATTTPASASGTGFTLSGAAGTATGCTLADPCTFTELQAALDDGGDAAVIGSIAVSKGRDFAWQGAIDGLRINDDLFDFEEYGVDVLDATP